jgi:hypothetical protein
MNYNKHQISINLSHKLNCNKVQMITTIKLNFIKNKLEIFLEKRGQILAIKILLKK